jgi:hypothetical protein
VNRDPRFGSDPRIANAAIGANVSLVETTREEGEVAAAPEGGKSHLNWAALLGGTGTSLGVWITLTALGFAIGLIAVSPRSPSLHDVAIWLIVWAGVVPVLSTFVGSLVATWAAGTVRAATGALYGFAVWGLSLAVAVLFTIQLMSGFAGRTLQASAQVASGAVNAAVTGVTGLASAVGQGGQNLVQGVGNFLSVDRHELLAPVNRRLQADGLPPVSMDQLQAAMQQVANVALRQGRLSEQTVVAALAQHTRMNPQEARQVANRIVDQWDQTAGVATGAVGQAWTATRDTVLRTLNAGGEASWWFFGSFSVALLGALGGGVLGSRIHRPRRRRVARVAEPRPVKPTVVRPTVEQPT